MTARDNMQKIHFIGIGGIGTSALARYYLATGWSVSGSDASDSSLLHALADEGVRVFLGEDANNLDDDADRVVYSEAIITKPDLSKEENLMANPELAKARTLGIENLSYPHALAELFNAKQFGVAVTGSHGKSTTTAMLGTILSRTGGSALAGTLVPAFGGRNILVDSHSEIFAIEACEYKRSFLAYHPTITVITNIDLDHLDYYRDLEDYISAFRSLCAQTRDYVVIAATDAHSAKLAQELPNAVRVYDSYYSVPDLVSGDFQMFSIPALDLRVKGEHMLADARLAYVTARLLGIEESIVVSALESYSGSWRRAEIVGTTAQGNIIMSDYGHHPNEIRPTLAAIKEANPEKKLVVCFEPHQYSRTIELLDGFLSSFDDADLLIIPSIYFSRDKHEDVEAMPAKRFVSLLQEKYPHTVYGEGLENTSTWLSRYDEQHPDTSIILLLGAGAVDSLREGFEYC
ncbi:MAG TPA: Mur ligase domain-containing protein [bacterium]|nr:Mur ligase domain-containing protein [bacterium]